MPEQRKRPARARIDAIISAIGKGTYDDKLGVIKEAVEMRYAEKRAELKERVLEVFGPEFEITEKPHPNPFIGKANRVGGADSQQPGDAKARAAAVAAEMAASDGNEQGPPSPAPGDPFGDGNVEDDAPRPVQPQAVEIVSAPERAASPAFGENAVVPPSTPEGGVQMSDDDGYESRSPIIYGGPPR